MTRLALILVVLAAGCAPKPTPLVEVTSRAPDRTLTCVEKRLAKTPLQTRRHMLAQGWRIDLAAFSGQPAGWVPKGSLIHEGNRVTYAPNGSTIGILDAHTHDALRPVLRRCR